MADDTYSRGYRNDPPGRRDTGASGQEVDPLTELARLIGQSDPFASVEQRRPVSRDPEPRAPSRDWPAESPPYETDYDDRARDEAQHPVHDAHYGAERRDYPADYDQQVAPADQGYGYEDGHEEQSYADHLYDSDRAGHDDGAGYDADPHGGHPDDLSRFYDDDAPAPRRRGWMLTAAALIGLAVVGAALAFAYRAVFTPGAPPLIARDAGPNKIIASSQSAEARGAKGVDRIPSGDQPERMVSHEERPIALPDTTRTAPGFGQSSAATLPEPMQSGSPSEVSSAGPIAPDGAAPRRVQTVTIPADGPAPVPAPPRTAAPRATAALAPAQPTPPPIAPRATASVPPPGQGGPLSLSPQLATAAPPPRAAARAPATAAAQAGSGYFVQVTAQRSEEEAQSSFRGIQAKYENLLGGHEPVIRRKDLGSKGIFFGAQVGPFSRESAVQLCDNLKSAGGSCMVQKN